MVIGTYYKAAVIRLCGNSASQTVDKTEHRTRPYLNRRQYVTEPALPSKKERTAFQKLEKEGNLPVSIFRFGHIPDYIAKYEKHSKDCRR